MYQEPTENSVNQVDVSQASQVARKSIWQKMRENRARNKGWFMRMNARIFGEKMPAMSEESINKAVVWLPWLSLIGGILCFAMTAYFCFDLYTALNRLLDNFMVNGSIVKALTIDDGWLPLRNIAIMYLLGISIIGIYFTICAAFAIAAFPGLMARSPRGWLLMYRSIVMVALVAYASIMNWTMSTILRQAGFDSPTSEVFLLPVVVSAVGLYLLFQTRSRYQA